MMMFAVLLALVVAQPANAAAPTPTPCWHQAQLVKAAQPVWPSSLPKNTPPFDVIVFVTVETDGTVQKAHIYRSSGYPAADAAAISAAKASTYKPGVFFNCKPQALDYLFRATFQPPSQ